VIPHQVVDAIVRQWLEDNIGVLELLSEVAGAARRSASHSPRRLGLEHVRVVARENMRTNP
jgi:hypothetical protein